MSVSKEAIRRGKILEEIMSYHRQRLPKVMRQVPLADLRALASVAPPAVSLFDAIKNEQLSLIAECKKASPSKGLLVRKYDAAQLAAIYVQAGAAAISVLTDARHFQGSLEDLQDVKAITSDLAKGSNKPHPVSVLRKDFIFDPYQVYESRAAGADAILLITAVLEGKDLERLLELAESLGMEALVETHSESELERALEAGARIVGINNRDLNTFKVDLRHSARLRGMIPQNVASVGESGIKTLDDVRSMADVGFDAILVGQTLVQSKDPRQTAASFVQAGRFR